MRDGGVRARRRAALRGACALALGALPLGPVACGTPVRVGPPLSGADALALLGVAVAPGVDAGLERGALDALAADAFRARRHAAL